MTRVSGSLSRALRNPLWVLMDVSSRFPVVRRRVRALARRRAAPHVPVVGPTILAPVDVEGFAQRLHVDGYSCGLALPTGVVEDLLTFAMLDVCYGHGDPACGFRYADRARAEAVSGRSFSLGSYLFTDGVQPVIDRVARDPLLQAIVGTYLGVPPVCTGTRLWWTFAVPEGQYDNSATTSFFHYDRDDFACLRVFFYLTAVDDQHGAHVVARGSHLHKPISQLFSLEERTDDEVLQWYGADSLITIHGAAGTGFAEDPFCFHKATRPIAGDRLVLEIRFAMRDYRVFPQVDRARARQLVP